MTSPVVFTVCFIVLLVVHHEVRQREAIVCAYEVYAVFGVASRPPLTPAVASPPVHSSSIRDSAIASKWVQ
jgi:hypothetical protein